MNNEEIRCCINIATLDGKLPYKKLLKEMKKEHLVDVCYELLKEHLALLDIKEYLTSYSSIHTIQFGTEEDSPNDIELNKTLDNKTIIEMTHRYLKVHDKLLQILDKVGDQNTCNKNI